MLNRTYAAGALVALLLVSTACSPPPDPISLEEHTVVVKNLTSRDWRNVRVTVNDHFSGGASTLAAGARLTAPLSQFQTGFGQRYDTAHQVVYKIEVTATDATGETVNLKWGRDRNR